ncbi:MAG: patatin-like phospholipase family protein [Sandaracinaceae bacterium]|nr:patatin-like phospholipase family protein [Myxococcales bacterium]MCB9656125.1 patatin-like phospholipase family protein [Sandaracinaceae bacterium]
MHSRTGIVLSGGGARGAYEVGVVAGIMDVLQPRRLSRAPFEIFTGTSVGAINSAWLASHAHRPDMDISGLVGEWEGLRLSKHLRFDPMGLLAGRRLRPLLSKLRRDDVGRVGRSFLDPRALEELVGRAIPFKQLHRNVDSGIVRSLVVASLGVEDGVTTMFSEIAPGAEFARSKDPRRRVLPSRIDARHVLASSAIPLIYPAREIDGRYFCDGGLRFNTPIAPALRCGAERLVVISLRSEARPDAEARQQALQAYPNPVFLIGKILNALLLDPVNYDLQVMDRFNRMIATLEDVLGETEMTRVQKVIKESRGAPYKKVNRLVFYPSEDIGRLAAARAHELRTTHLSPHIFSGDLKLEPGFQADLLSFVLFDGEFASRLVALGRRDAHARAAAIHRFFDA